MEEYEMAIVKVFNKESSGPIDRVIYCVKGMYVYLRGFLGASSSRKVTTCDSTCKEKPTIQELGFNAEALNELRFQLGKDSTKYPPPM